MPTRLIDAATFGKRLIDAATLEKEYAIPKGTSYRLARSGLIPSYRIGPRMHGVRFIAEEVLEALRRPAPAPLVVPKA